MEHPWITRREPWGWIANCSCQDYKWTRMLWHLIHKSSKGTSGQQCRCDEILIIITMLLLMVIDHHYINKSLCLTIIIVAVIIVIIDVAVIAVINAVADVVVGVAKSVPSLQWWPQWPLRFMHQDLSTFDCVLILVERFHILSPPIKTEHCHMTNIYEISFIYKKPTSALLQIL